MARSYYASKIISNKIARTPQGFLLCRDAVIARTGWQTYMVRDLPTELAKSLGIDTSDQEATIDLYRSPEEVFRPETVASFEGQTITDNHPPEFVDAHNFLEHACGHLQAVRKGDQPLETGDWPLLADILITVEPLATNVENDVKRELSCGYDYSIRREGNKILQIGILGNHVAVVPKGRAGAEARINDSAHVDGAGQVIDGSIPIQKKETEKVAKTNFISRLLGLGLKAMANDEAVKPEDLAEAAAAIKAQDSDEEEAKKKENEAKDAKAAKDAEEAEKAAKSAKDAEEAEAAKKAKDAEQEEDKPAVREIGDARCKDCADETSKCRDCRMHDALDSALEANPEQEGEEADLEELREIMSEFFASAEAQPGSDAETGSEVLEPVGDSEEKKPGQDSSIGDLEKVITKTADSRVKKAFDSADSITDELEFLRALRPAIARSKDLKVRKAFDTAVRKFTRSSQASNGGYGGFVQSASFSRARDSRSSEQDYSKLDAAFAARRGKNPTEVKS